MPSHLWHCYLPLPKQVTSHANNSDEALQQCQLLSQLLLELLVALLPLRIVAYGILRQMVSSSALKHQFLSWNMWGKKVRWTHGNKTKQRNTGSLHPWCNPWCNPYWPPLGCERQKSTVQFPLYIRKLGACPKQAFLPSTLSGEVFYFMLLLDSLELPGDTVSSSLLGNPTFSSCFCSCLCCICQANSLIHHAHHRLIWLPT